jgi:hypothetical protein
MEMPRLSLRKFQRAETLRCGICWIIYTSLIFLLFLFYTSHYFSTFQKLPLFQGMCVEPLSALKNFIKNPMTSLYPITSIPGVDVLRLDLQLDLANEACMLLCWRNSELLVKLHLKTSLRVYMHWVTGVEVCTRKQHVFCNYNCELLGHESPSWGEVHILTFPTLFLSSPIPLQRLCFSKKIQGWAHDARNQVVHGRDLRKDSMCCNFKWNNTIACAKALNQESKSLHDVAYKTFMLHHIAFVQKYTWICDVPRAVFGTERSIMLQHVFYD